MSGRRKIWLLGLNDLRLTVRNRAAFFWMLVMPIAFMWLFSHLGGEPAGTPAIYLAVDDRDAGWLAEALVAELDDESVELHDLADAPSEAEAQAEPARVLIIPRGFTEGALGGEQQTLQLASRPDANPQYNLAAQMHVVRVVGRLLGRLTEAWPEQAGEEQAGEEQAIAMRGAIERLADRPPLVELSVTTAGRGRPVPSGAAQSVPGTLTMIVLMMTVIYGGVFLATEKQQGTLRRQAALPLSRGQIFAGKLFGRVLLAAIQIAVLITVGSFVFGVSWGSSPLGLVLVLSCYALAVAGLATLLGALAATPDQASGIGWISSMVMAALGGCWWPSEVMPGWLRAVGHAFPTAWAMDAFHSLISFGRGAEAVLLPSLVLLGFAALFSWLGARFLRIG